METDRYPAVRHLAWRAARRLRQPPGRICGRLRPLRQRRRSPRVVGRLRGSQGTVEVPQAAALAAVRARAQAGDQDRDLEIGE
jgi:hypothetical protein